LQNKLIRANKDLLAQLNASQEESTAKIKESLKSKTEVEREATARVSDLQGKLNDCKLRLVELEKSRSEQENIIEKFQSEKADIEDVLKKAFKLEKDKLEQSLKQQLQANSQQEEQFFQLKSENERRAAVLEEKLTQQQDQINILKEKQRGKEEELMTFKTNYALKLQEVKQK